MGLKITLKILVFTFEVITLALSNEIVSEKTSNSTENCDLSCVMSGYLNETVDPCDNFYEFACGRFIKEKNILETEVENNALIDATMVYLGKMKDFLTVERNQTKSKAFLLSKAFYDSCMNTSFLEEDGANVIHNIVDSLGGIPILKEHNWDLNGTWDWQEASVKLTKMGLKNTQLFTFYDRVYNSNISQRLISPPKILTRTTKFEFVLKKIPEDKAMQDIFVDFGANETFLMQELQKLNNFNNDLRMAMNSSSKNYDRNVSYVQMTFDELQNNFTYINWNKFTRILFPENFNSTSKTLWVYSPFYLENLENVLKNTEKRVIANYMLAKVYLGSMQLLSDKYLNYIYDLGDEIVRKSINAPRWKRCVGKAHQTLQIAVESLNAQNLFDLNIRNDVSQMVEVIRDEILTFVSNFEWMDNATKAIAVEKLKATKVRVGFPDEYLDEKKVTEYYDGLHLDANDHYFKNHFKIQAFLENKKLSQLGLEINPNDWTSTYASLIKPIVNIPLSNSIEILPFALEAFYDKKKPNYVNYGKIGFTIAHEMVHSIDCKYGHLRDKYGNFMPKSWWPYQTVMLPFFYRALCIYYQYGQNAITWNEDMVDNAAFEISYKAYKKWNEEHGPEEKLPGLNYTNEQMYWISLGHFFCSKRAEGVIIPDTHSPAIARVNQGLKNSNEFAEDFKCPSESPMNPVDKCDLW